MTRVAAALLCPLLAGCGSNLLIQRQDAEVCTAAGATLPLRIAFVVPEGIGTGEGPLAARAAMGLLVEPLDWLWSTGIALQAIVDPDLEVAGGPFGYLAALTPFATLVPMLHLPPRTTATVDDATFAQLQDADPELRAQAARSVLRDASITRCDRR